MSQQYITASQDQSTMVFTEEEIASQQRKEEIARQQRLAGGGRGKGGPTPSQGVQG